MSALRGICLRAATALFVFVLPVAAQQPSPPAPQDPPASESAPAVDAKTALRRAADHVAGLKGVRGTARIEGLREAASVYRQIATDFEARKDVVAQARFEAGECVRRAGDVAEAEADYAACLATGEMRFKERAAFQRGSMLRRLKRFEEAVASYREAVGVRPTSARADDGRRWIARCLEQKGDIEDALTAHGEAIDKASTPTRAVAACDRLASFQVQQNRLDAAESTLQRADALAAPVLERGGKAAERMQAQLDGLKAKGALRRARDKQRDAAGDAIRLEQDASSRSGG